MQAQMPTFISSTNIQHVPTNICYVFLHQSKRAQQVDSSNKDLPVMYAFLVSKAKTYIFADISQNCDK